jgi:hypothetical protein
MSLMISRLSGIEHPPHPCVWWVSDADPAHRSVVEIGSRNGKVCRASGVNSLSSESRRRVSFSTSHCTEAKGTVTCIKATAPRQVPMRSVQKWGRIWGNFVRLPVVFPHIGYDRG